MKRFKLIIAISEETTLVMISCIRAGNRTDHHAVGLVVLTGAVYTVLEMDI
jgi:hypothetical protein